MRVSDNKIRWR